MVQEATARHFTFIEKLMLEKKQLLHDLNTLLLNWGVTSLDIAFTQQVGLLSVLVKDTELGRIS